jgi:hypothetical protein
MDAVNGISSNQNEQLAHAAMTLNLRIGEYTKRPKQLS